MTHQEQREELGMVALADLFSQRCCINCVYMAPAIVNPHCLMEQRAAMESGGRDCELFERRER